MIITRTPFRLSFFGGGTDLPYFFNQNGGAVISSTFDKYCYVNVCPLPQFHPYKSELVHNTIERINDINEIEHPLIRECMRNLDIHKIRLTYEGDLPSRSGLGTSSTFAVGMLNALYALKGLYMDKRLIAEQAIHIERDILKEKGGWQDQIAAAYGGLNKIEFKDNSFIVKPVIMDSERKKMLNDNLILFYTGRQRMSSEIQSDTFSRPKENVDRLKEILSLVNEAEDVLVNPNRSLDDFGHLLNTTWRLKRGMGEKVSNDEIDNIYETALNNGALGGKLLGAGGGGFFIFYCEKEGQNRLKESLSDLKNVPFKFEDKGTQIIYNNEYER